MRIILICELFECICKFVSFVYSYVNLGGFLALLAPDYFTLITHALAFIWLWLL